MEQQHSTDSGSRQELMDLDLSQTQKSGFKNISVGKKFQKVQWTVATEWILFIVDQMCESHQWLPFL